LQAAISHALGDRLHEAVQLLKDGQYRAAIAIAAISLEQRLICLLSGDSYHLFRGRGLTQMLRELEKQHLISRDDAERLAPIVKLRNMAVHANDAVPTRDDAELAITTIQQFLSERTTENCR
jgi:HEPN domain-containing protein